MTTSTYIVKEMQNVPSYREGASFSGTLTSAKRFASRNQFFKGTVLKIESETGTLISYKKYGSNWVDTF